MERRARSEMERLLAEEHRKTEAAIEVMRRDAYARIETMRRECEQRERGLIDQIADLEREQEKAKQRMEREVAQNLERQQEALRRKLVEIRADAERRINETMAAMREEHRRQYRKMNERIDKLARYFADLREAERLHARKTIERAYERVKTVSEDESVNRFLQHRLHWLRDTYNAAAREYKEKNYVQSDGQAMLAIAECDRCVADSIGEREKWERNCADAKKRLAQCRELLGAMETPTEVSAAGSTREGVLLKAWNQEGWQKVKEFLDELENELNNPVPISGPEVAKIIILLKKAPEDISEEMRKARNAVITYLHIRFLLLYLCAAIQEIQEDWEIEYQKLEAVTNTASAELALPDGIQRCALTIVEYRNSHVIQVILRNGSYDTEDSRKALLKKLENRMRDELRGIDAPRVDVLLARAFREGDVMCGRFDLSIEDSIRQMEQTNGQEAEQPGDQQADGRIGTNRTELAKEIRA